MAAVVVGLLAAVPASAAPGDDGLWYYSATGMDDIHQTTRGEGITVAILDSPINSAFPDLVGANLNVHEPSFCAAEEGGPALPATSAASEANHGTGLATLLVGTGVGVNGQAGIPGIAPDITLNYYTTHFKTPDSSFVQCTEVRGAEPTPSATPTPEAPADTGAQTDDADDTVSGAPIGLIAGIVGGVALALIITVVLIGRRRTGPAVRKDREDH